MGDAVNSSHGPQLEAIAGQKSFSGSLPGSPVTTRKMLDFCAHHGIEAVAQHSPMSEVNEAFAHLAAGKARYRVALDNT
jgi:uncharacterized zinc-type alcohol dehydrogenase-like protein